MTGFATSRGRVRYGTGAAPVRFERGRKTMRYKCEVTYGTIVFVEAEDEDEATEKAIAEVCPIGISDVNCSVEEA
jgi:hypothetical protein